MQQPADTPGGRTEAGSRPDWRPDLALARELADLADGITTARFRAHDLTVSSKPDLSLVTDADRAVEQAIRDRLADLRPHDALLGEEFGRVGDSERQWVIDPIDGTHNFVRGVPVWATLIGLLQGPEPVLGVVSAPALGQRWWAATGHGAYGQALGAEPRRLRVSAVAARADASMSYSSLHGWGDRLPRLVELLGGLWRSRAYGDFWSYMLLAEGAVDLAAEPELSLWDMAALAPIVVEAGGRFTGLDGVPGVHQGNAAASNGLLHEALLSALGDR
ncbi:MAG TPA: inositol monophosphatase family protein [Jatrophihabitans sp.]|nr:inositol monophosphatase family protein [Jatrophihabitans sp.]